MMFHFPPLDFQMSPILISIFILPLLHNNSRRSRRRPPRSRPIQVNIATVLLLYVAVIHSAIQVPVWLHGFW